MTYTADGMVATVKDANNHATSYQYDSQDRLTTVTNPDWHDGSVYAYNSQGNVTSVTDERGNTTTYQLRRPEPRDRHDRRLAQPHDATSTIQGAT